MASFLRRLLGSNQQVPESSLDLAQGDWTPVPPSEVGTDWANWLQDAEPRRRDPLPPPAVQAKQAPGLLLEAVAVQPQPLPLPGAKAAAATRPPAVAAPKARARARTLPPHERKWRDFLKEFAEHLTDEELVIIRKQFAG